VSKNVVAKTASHDSYLTSDLHPLYRGTIQDPLYVELVLQNYVVIYLKDNKVGKAYEYFSSGWLQEGYFLKAKSNNNNNLCILRTKCSPSQTYHIAPKKMMV
jgi:hypothetical protein